jgi:hypothetical protein
VFENSAGEGFAEGGDVGVGSDDEAFAVAGVRITAGTARIRRGKS